MPTAVAFVPRMYYDGTMSSEIINLVLSKALFLKIKQVEIKYTLKSGTETWRIYS